VHLLVEAPQPGLNEHALEEEGHGVRMTAAGAAAPGTEDKHLNLWIFQLGSDNQRSHRLLHEALLEQLALCKVGAAAETTAIVSKHAPESNSL